MDDDMLNQWQSLYTSLSIKDYYDDDKGIFENFTAKLIYSGYEKIGSGMCACVYKHPDSTSVIKVSRIDNEKYPFSCSPTKDSKPWDEAGEYDGSWSKEFLEAFLFYTRVSFDGHCAIQPFADCSALAQIEAEKVIGEMALRQNIGMYQGKAVVVDDY